MSDELPPPNVPVLGLAFAALLPDGIREWPSEEEILATTGISRSEAEEVAEQLRQSLLRMIANDPDWRTRRQVTVARAVIDFMASGARSLVDGEYCDEFRSFVVGLVDRDRVGEGISTADLAEAAAVPLEVVEDWLRAAGRLTEEPSRIS